MPHAVFDLGSLSTPSSADHAARQLIPGIEPGSSRAGADFKPALLIRDAYIQLNEADIPMSSQTYGANVFLKLSQEQDLTPGLLLLVGGFRGDINRVTTASEYSQDVAFQQLGSKLAGQIWVPHFVGIRLETDSFTTLDLDVHLDYERIEIPFMDWFIQWDFLDNVIDNSREY